jgi:hypothetical protein
MNPLLGAQNFECELIWGCWSKIKSEFSYFSECYLVSHSDSISSTKGDRKTYLKAKHLGRHEKIASYAGAEAQKTFPK